ncbi:hypothetical protein QBC37DRAFT_356358 [Rhypophila decipiens]|uniref:Uncharacterized protein n=1 Tax=Rhypophila decipiens TaxID=261697 RepID=A0AAN6XUD3_9PEZI|nr:hypothetical protein QBC37DRAFT_356358 [Rhypophila decipiens]
MFQRHSAVLKVALSSLSLIASAAFYGIRVARPPTDADCTELLFPGSPANEAVEYHWENFRDHYVPYAVYRGPPTPDRQAAWDEFTPFGVVGVAPSHPISTRAAFAVPGVVLQMNCLKLLRQFVYRDYNQTLFTPSSRQQVDRCISVLREHLVCACDTTPYLIANNASFPRGIVPVTGNDHYCRSYDKVLEWAASHFVSPHHSLLDSILVV